MTLPPATRLGPYEVLSLLGAGGMGEVYRARDTRLGRTVAIKVLPEHLSGNPQARERFEREARSVSNLTHPHICTLHDVGHQDGVDFLVMEYLEGETLAHRLNKGRLPTDQLLRYAIEIAGALDHAHRRGVIHRDLKPGNVMLTKSGAKVLDFGLAKVLRNEPEQAVASAVATRIVTEALTAEGSLVGTLPYMAPEQLEGKEADARTDIFAFGAVFYEMATGRRAFEGKSQASLIAAILEHEPSPISSLNLMTAPALDRVVRRCLAKDPEERVQTARDLKSELEWLVEQGTLLRNQSAPFALQKRTWPIWAGVVLAAVVAAAGADYWWRNFHALETPELRYLTYSGHDSSPAASVDGKTIAFSSERDGQARIWLKELVGGSEVALTSGGPDTFPRLSPDGSAVLFSRGRTGHASLYRVPVIGGEPRKLVDDVIDADWSPDGRQIVFTRARVTESALGFVGADGRDPHEIAHLEKYQLLSPRWSPDGRTIAAVQRVVGTGQPASIFLVGADGKQQRSLRAAPGGFAISSVAWSGVGDELVYSQTDSLQASLISAGGTSRIIRQNIGSGAVYAAFRSPHNGGVLDIVGAGRLVFDVASNRENLREIPLGGRAPSPQYRWLTHGYSQDRQPAYSADGEWVIFTSNRSGNLDLWEISTRTGALRRITDDPADDWDPVFTHDGKKIIWSSNRSGHLEIWIADADGSGARQLTNDGVDAENPEPTPDGAWIIYRSTHPDKRGVWKIRSDGSQATRLAVEGFGVAAVSPDGKYVAYGGTGVLHVARIADGIVVPFEMRGVGRRRWTPDGRAIAFIGQDEKGVSGVFAQDFVEREDTTRTRRRLGGFDPEMVTETFDMSPDGSRLTIASVDRTSSLMVAERVPNIAPPVRHGR